MSENKKGFRQAKKPTKAQLEKTLDEQLPTMQQTQQFMGQQLFSLMQNVRQISNEVQAAANLFRLDEAPASIKAEKGHTIMMDFVGTLKENGKLFNGSYMLGSVIELGSNSLIPGFEDKVVGMSCGESRDIEVTFPENYQAKHLAGKEAVFTVTLLKIWQKTEGSETVQAKFEALTKAEEEAKKAAEAAKEEATKETTPPQGA